MTHTQRSWRFVNSHLFRFGFCPVDFVQQLVAFNNVEGFRQINRGTASPFRRLWGIKANRYFCSNRQKRCDRGLTVPKLVLRIVGLEQVPHVWQKQSFKNFHFWCKKWDRPVTVTTVCQFPGLWNGNNVCKMPNSRNMAMFWWIDVTPWRLTGVKFLLTLITSAIMVAVKGMYPQSKLFSVFTFCRMMRDGGPLRYSLAFANCLQKWFVTLERFVIVLPNPSADLDLDTDTFPTALSAEPKSVKDLI